MRHGVTFDLVVKDVSDMMTLLSVCASHIYGPELGLLFMRNFVNLKFKMKLSYSCWQRKKDLYAVVMDAI